MGTADRTASLPGRLAAAVDLRLVLGVFSGLVLLYVYLPVFSLIAFSFNEGGLSFPFVGVTTEWYSVLFQDESTIAAITRSIQLALVVTAIGTTMATAVAVAYLFGFPGDRLLLYLLVAGIVIPGITYSAGTNILLNQLLGLERNLWLATPVHVVWTLPFATIFLVVGLPSNLREQVEAARMMGADGRTVFTEVMLPQIWLSVVGAAIITFTLSYNEGTRSLLLVGQDTTMAIHVFSVSATATLSPDLFALGSVTALVSTVLLVVAGLLVFHFGE